MSHSIRTTHASLWTYLALLATTAVLLAFLGCGSDDKNPVNPGGGTTPSTTFTGVLANGTESGKLSITVNSTSLARGLHGAPAGAVTATGTLTIVGGSAIPLTGSYDSELDTLYLAGGGYLIRGAYYTPTDQPPSMNGEWVGPSGAGFWGCFLGSGNAVKVYCGTFTINLDGGGVISLVAYADTAVVGLAQVSGDDVAVFLDGTLSRNETSPGIKTVTLSGTDTHGGVLAATGELTVVTNSISGTWVITTDSTPTSDGTWQAELCP